NDKSEGARNDSLGDFIEISVADTGIGISPDDQKRLFQPFQQLETTLSKKYPGTGLGLNLSKKLVELHGGWIWVESEVGKGSRFTFVIPMRQNT
ncbi:MAG: ATP-binding protein, partial [Nitrospirota bacterium]